MEIKKNYSVFKLPEKKIISDEKWSEISPDLGIIDYEVSTSGKLRNIYIDCIKQNSLIHNGYLYDIFALENGKKKQKIFYDYIVAKTFISNPENMLYVEHKDGDKLNNKVENEIVEYNKKIEKIEKSNDWIDNYIDAL